MTDDRALESTPEIHYIVFCPACHDGEDFGDVDPTGETYDCTCGRQVTVTGDAR